MASTSGSLTVYALPQRGFWFVLSPYVFVCFCFFLFYGFFLLHRGKWCIWKAYTGSETPVLGISKQLTGPYSQAARCICMWFIEFAYTQYNLCLFINTTVWFIFCWGHAHRPGPRSPSLRRLLSGLGRAAFRSCCPVPAGRMLLRPPGVPPLGCTSQGVMASAALGQAVRGFLGRYGKCLIRKLPCALRYCQCKSCLVCRVGQPPRVWGKPAASCRWRGARGARLVPAASIRPAPASPPPPGAGPAPLFWGLQGESVLHPTLKMLTRSFTSDLRQADHSHGETVCSVKRRRFALDDLGSSALWCSASPNNFRQRSGAKFWS